MTAHTDLNELAGDVAIICDSEDGGCDCPSCGAVRRSGQTLTRIAEAIKANPEGFRNWFKITQGVEL